MQLATPVRLTPIIKSQSAGVVSWMVVAVLTPFTPAQFAEPFKRPSFSKQDVIHSATAIASRTFNVVITILPFIPLATISSSQQESTECLSLLQAFLVHVCSIHNCPFLCQN